MSASLMAIVVAFMVYLAGMLLIGLIYMKKTQNTEDYFLGGRSLNGWVAALSAQASDMSGWLLMGLPGAIYAYGTGQAWIAIGLFLGTVCNWMFISGRLRAFTIRANNSLTLPEYFENRFEDKKRVLLTVSSAVIVIFFLVYTASALAAGGKLFNVVFGLDYKVALTIGVVVILLYTFMGGFMAVCVTDFIQGLLMLTGLLIVPIIAYMMVGPENVKELIEKTEVVGSSKLYLNIMYSNGEKYTIIDIISQLAWGLGYCGMPHILTRFMAVKNENELKKSRAIAISWVALSLTFGCIIGVIGRAYLYPVILDSGHTENVFIEMIKKVFSQDLNMAFLGGIFLCGILAAIMSTADSQLLVTASAMAEDLFKGTIKKDANEKTVLLVSRITVIVVAVLAYCIALDPNSSIMGLVSNAWAGLGAAFGPVVVLSLFWKRANLYGALTGMISGGLTVIMWDYIPIIKVQESVENANGLQKFFPDHVTLSTATGLYSLAVGFIVAIVLNIVVSLLTKAPSENMKEMFDDVVARKNIK